MIKETKFGPVLMAYFLTLSDKSKRVNKHNSIFPAFLLISNGFPAFVGAWHVHPTRAAPILSSQHLMVQVSLPSMPLRAESLLRFVAIEKLEKSNQKKKTSNLVIVIYGIY